MICCRPKHTGGGIFYRETMRKLATACGFYAAGIFLAIYLLPVEKVLWTAVGIMMLAAALLATHRKWLRGVEIGLVFLAVGLCVFRVNYEWREVPCEALVGEHTVVCEVLDYAREGEDYHSLTLRLKEKSYHGAKLRLYDYSGQTRNLTPGDTVCLTASMRSASERYGEEYYGRLAEGIYLTGTLKGEISILSEHRTNLRSLPSLLSKSLLERVDESYTGETAVFLKALLLGEKTELYRQTDLYHDLSRAGLMHAVAVSGMHIAFLIAFMEQVLGHSRRWSVLGLTLVWSFVFVVGVPASALRAAIMQSAVLIAPLLKREADDITSLFAALGLILLWNPYAAAGVGLQLSFASMLGILLFGQKLTELFTAGKSKHRIGRILRPVGQAAAASLSALSLSLPLCAYYFGYVALLAPLASVMTTWAISFAFRYGYLSILLSAVIPTLGVWLSKVVEVSVRYILMAARWIASIPFASSNTENPYFLLTLVMGYILLLGSAYARAEKKFRIAGSIGGIMLMLGCAVGFTRLSSVPAFGELAVLDVGQGQCVVARTAEHTVMVDCGNKLSGRDAGDKAAAYLEERSVDEVDTLILTHLHTDHGGGVARFMERVRVNEVIILPDGSAEEDLFDEIEDACERNGVELTLLLQEEKRSWGAMTARIYPPEGTTTENENCAFVLLSIGSYDLLISGDNPKSSERGFIAHNHLPEVEAIVVGHHGARNASCGEYLAAVGAKTAIISVGYNNYGHPTYETLERLAAYGYNIYRTDLNGTVTITVGEEYGG